MNKTTLSVIALLSLLIAASWAEPVQLTFDWHPGLKMDVIAASEGSVMMQSDYTLTVDSLGKDLSVKVSAFNLSDSQLLSTSTMGLPQETIAAMAESPNLRVTTNGSFVGITDAVARVEAAKESLRGFSEEGQLSFPAELESLIGVGLSEVAMESAAGNAWSSVVGFWAGKKVMPGEWATETITTTVPMFPDTDLEMDVRYRMAEASPCSDGYNGRGCVQLERVAKPKEGSLKELMKAFLSEALGGEEITMDSIEEITVENKSTLITDPSNLQPQRLEMETTFRIVMKMGGLTLPVVEQVDKQTLRYTYPKPE